MHAQPWWRTIALAGALISACLPFVVRAVIGQAGSRVHVRWQASVDPTERQHLEARYRLADGRRLDATTWRYDLIDPSSGNIRALVSDPAVADTHDIDRPNYSLDPAAVRTARRRLFAGGDVAVSAGDGLAVLLATLAALLVVIGWSGHAQTPRSAHLFISRVILDVWHTARAAVAPGLRWLQRGIPDVDARTAGLFRIVFGIAVLAFFDSHAVDASWLSPGFNRQVEGALHASVLQWLRGHPEIVDFLGPWLLTMGVAFTAGIFTRLTYGLFVAGASVWAYVAMPVESIHVYTMLTLTLVALLPSRWGDGCSIDAWLRRSRTGARAAPAGGRQYGYSVWVPGLVFGVAFAGAAWAKLSRPEGWTAWILNGSVKYHFITDSLNAPVDWGLQLAAHPQLAILASLGAIAIEALAVTAAFRQSALYRLSMGMAVLSLLVGFRLFMGVLWAAWWIPLLGFLPWQWLSRGSRVRSTPHATHEPPPWAGRGLALSATAAQLVVIVFILAQQIVFSTLTIERAPMFSDYHMYSHTFASPAEFDAWMPPYVRIVVSTNHGNVELPCNAPENMVKDSRAALGGSRGAAAGVWRAVRGCRGEDISDAHQVTFEEDRRTFDWNRLQFTIRRAAVVHGPLPADAEVAAPRPADR